MLANHNLITSIICGIIFISISRAATTAALDDVLSLEDFLIGSNADTRMFVGDDEYQNSIYNYDISDRPIKRQVPQSFKQNMDEIFPRFPVPTEKVRQLIRVLQKPKKSEFLTLNGWSASGMPFNVLYTPNSLQQKFLERRPPPIPTPQNLQRENYETEGKDDKKYMQSGMKSIGRPSQMRKHYLVIPQLFVSYGWGSLGK